MNKRGIPTTWRAALAQLAALGGLLSAAGGARAAAPRPRAVRLLAGLSDLASARRIGRLYLRDHPEEADLASLGASLEAALGHDARRSVLRRAVRAAVQADMEAGRSVLVDGWILARTEARLCALAVLA